MNSIDLFCGAGGFSEGLYQAGIQTRIAVDFDEQAIHTFSHNHPKVRTICADIAKLNPKNLLAKAELEKGELDLIVGGPPCQGFSLAGSRLPDDPKNKLVLEYKKIVKGVMPKFFIFENVPGIMSMESGKVVEALCNEFRELGYALSVEVINAADYGVPQSRPRFIMIGSREGIKVGFPLKTHSENGNKYKISLLDQKLPSYVTVKDALFDLPNIYQGEGGETMPHSEDPQNEYQLARRGRREPGTIYNQRATRHCERIVERYSMITQGCNNKCLPEEMRTKKNNVFKIHEDSPSRTVTCNFRTDLLHPWNPRGLTVREAARLQSFDDDYQFFGNLTRKAKWVTQDDQVGNAMPPLLAKALGEHILSFGGAINAV